MSNDDDSKRWRINREIPVVFLATLVGVAMTALFSFTNLAAKVAINEVTATANALMLTQGMSEIKESVRRLNDKMDRVIETRGLAR